jgi:hypothetical protein
MSSGGLEVTVEISTTTTTLVRRQEVFTSSEESALVGFLAGYSGLTREAYALDLRQYVQWSTDRSISLSVGDGRTVRCRSGAHVRRPHLDYESHAVGLYRNEVGAMLVGAGLTGARARHAGPPGRANGAITASIHGTVKGWDRIGVVRPKGMGSKQCALRCRESRPRKSTTSRSDWSHCIRRTTRSRARNVISEEGSAPPGADPRA